MSTIDNESQVKIKKRNLTTKGDETQDNSSNNNNTSNSNSSVQKKKNTRGSNNGYLVIGGIIIFILCLSCYPLIIKMLTGDSFGSIKSLETSSILNGMKKISHWAKNNGQCFNKTVAVGYNTNLDLIVNSIELMQVMGHQPSGNPTPSDIISTEQSLIDTFTYYFKSGSAAERFIDNKELFEKIIKATNGLNRREFHTGGNAGIMANRLRQEGCSVYLGGVVGKKLKELLDQSINIIEYKGENQSEDFDEVHLIMEYSRNSTWGGLETTRANRFIVSSDDTNSKMLTLESFHQHFNKGGRPHLIILSGLHLLEESLIQERIKTMMSSIKTIPYSDRPNHLVDSSHNIPIHLELASMSSVTGMKSIANKVVPFIDSIGLNEQELGFLYTTTGGSKYTLADFRDPKINTVVDAIIHIFKLASNINNNNNNNNNEDGLPIEGMGGDHHLVSDHRILTRIHFHYLTYHIVATRKQSVWSSSRSAMSVSASSLEASHQACGFKDVDIKIPLTFDVDYRYTPGSKLKLKIDEAFPVTTWQDEGIEFHIAPVLVCKHPLKTVGLGDSISTIGFMYQTIKS